MKRELKRLPVHSSSGQIKDCRAYPDEKGIETKDPGGTRLPACVIAEPIPMKRELKLIPFCGSGVVEHCRAYPDEKGIETESQKLCARLGY